MGMKRWQRRVQLLERIRDEKEWIEQCEQDPNSSYYGENGEAVRKADRDVLDRYISEYRQLGGVFV